MIMAKLCCTMASFVLACSCSIRQAENFKPLEPSKIIEIDTLAARYLKLNRFSGAILISIDERIVFNETFGLANYETGIKFSDETAFKSILSHISANHIS